jgi:hypothetical protein
MNIDLNLSHYSIEDLCRFFDVKPNCTAQELVQKESNLLSRLIQMSMKESKKKDIELFVRCAKEKLLSKPDSVVNVDVNPVSPGQLNYVKRITQYKNLNLNSCFRSNYYQSSSSNFQYILPVEILNVVSMRLASIELPNAGYLFTSKNNTFTISFHIGVVTTEHLIRIPEGNYDSDTFQLFLNQTYFYQSTTSPLELRNIVFSIDPHSFKSTFAYTVANTTTYTLQFSELVDAPDMNTCGWIMGFRMPLYERQRSTQSEGLFDASGDHCIYFALNDYQYNNNGVNLVGLSQSMMDQDILAKVLMSQEKLSIVIDDSYNPLTKTRRYNGPVNIRKISVTLYDKYGMILDLNQMDFSFTLEMEILYEHFT